MNKLLDFVNLHAALGRGLDASASPAAARHAPVRELAVPESGWLKVTTWDSTVELFRSEYHVPLLPPYLAAVAGAFGELFFPILLVFGLFTRVGAIGLFAVNAMAVVSYWHVLGGEGFEAARGQHVPVGLHARGRRHLRRRPVLHRHAAREALRGALPAACFRRRDDGLIC